MYNRPLHVPDRMAPARVCMHAHCQGCAILYSASMPSSSRPSSSAGSIATSTSPAAGPLRAGVRACCQSGDSDVRWPPPRPRPARTCARACAHTARWPLLWKAQPWNTLKGLQCRTNATSTSLAVAAPPRASLCAPHTGFQGNMKTGEKSDDRVSQRHFIQGGALLAERGRARGGSAGRGGCPGAWDDVGVVGAHERAANRRLLLLQHLVQRPVACAHPQRSCVNVL